MTAIAYHARVPRLFFLSIHLSLHAPVDESARLLAYDVRAYLV